MRMEGTEMTGKGGEEGRERDIRSLDKDRLYDFVVDAAKRWLAHDGLWFQAVENAHGLEEAMRLDGQAWDRFTAIEADRIRRFLNLPSGGGLDALERALRFRLYALVNDQETERVDDHTLVFKMKRCRVQEARERKGLAPFPCRPVGLIEYSGFARAIDPRIVTTCLACPPDPHPAEYFCAWQFTLLPGPVEGEREREKE